MRRAGDRRWPSGPASRIGGRRRAHQDWPHIGASVQPPVGLRCSTDIRRGMPAPRKERPWPSSPLASSSSRGVHFGHQTRRWNPKMKRFIFTERNGIYIIDLQQSLALHRQGLRSSSRTPSPTAARSSSSAPRSRRRRPSPSRPPASACPTSTSAGSAACSPTSRPCTKRIQRLKELEGMDFDDVAASGLTKKELLQLEPREEQARQDPRRHPRHGRHAARPCGSSTPRRSTSPSTRPASCTSRSSASSTPTATPTRSTTPIPGNDDAIRSVALLTRVIADAVADGLIERSGRSRAASEAEAEPMPDWERELLGADAQAAAPRVERRGSGRRAPRPPAVEAEAAARGRGRGRRGPRRPRLPPSRLRPPAVEAEAARRRTQTPPTPTDLTRTRRETPPMAITAADVKKLRDATGAGMMDAQEGPHRGRGRLRQGDRAAAHLGPGQGRQARRPRGHQRHRRRPRRRADPVRLRDRLRRQERRVRRPGRDIVAAVDRRGRQGRGRRERGRPLASGARRSTTPSRSSAQDRREALGWSTSPTSTAPPHVYLHRRAADLPPQVGVLVEYDGRRRRCAHQVAHADRRDVARSTSPATRSRPTSSRTSARIAEATAKEEGKPERRHPAHRRGPRRRLLQGRRAARPGRRSATTRSRWATRSKAGGTVHRALRALRRRRLTQVEQPAAQ